MVVLCDCGMAASGGVRSCCLVLSCLVLSLSSVVSVFGVVRAQLCEHAVIPEHHCVFSLLIVCFAFFSFFFCSSLLLLPLLSAFLCLEWRRVCLPCVGVFGGHDGNGESVSSALVFLVVACSSFSVSAVAASAVAFGA